MHPSLVVNRSRLGLSVAIKPATDWTCVCLAEGVLAWLGEASDFLKRVERSGAVSQFIKSSSNLQKLSKIQEHLDRSQQRLQLALINQTMGAVNQGREEQVLSLLPPPCDQMTSEYFPHLFLQLLLPFCSGAHLSVGACIDSLLSDLLQLDTFECFLQVLYWYGLLRMARQQLPVRQGTHHVRGGSHVMQTRDNKLTHRLLHELQKKSGGDSELLREAQAHMLHMASVQQQSNEDKAWLQDIVNTVWMLCTLCSLQYNVHVYDITYACM